MFLGIPFKQSIEYIFSTFGIYHKMCALLHEDSKQYIFLGFELSYAYFLDLFFCSFHHLGVAGVLFGKISDGDG